MIKLHSYPACLRCTKAFCCRSESLALGLRKLYQLVTSTLPFIKFNWRAKLPRKEEGFSGDVTSEPCFSPTSIPLSSISCVEKFTGTVLAIRDHVQRFWMHQRARRLRHEAQCGERGRKDVPFSPSPQGWWSATWTCFSGPPVLQNTFSQLQFVLTRIWVAFSTWK